MNEIIDITLAENRKEHFYEKANVYFEASETGSMQVGTEYNRRLGSKKGFAKHAAKMLYMELLLRTYLIKLKHCE